MTTRARLAPSGEETIAGINVTPFVDVALVLLVIFMVAAVQLATRTTIPFELPHTEGRPRSPYYLRLGVDRAGSISLDERPLPDAQLPATLASLAARAPGVVAVIAADPHVSHGRVVQLVDALREAGVRDFTFQTDLPR